MRDNSETTTPPSHRATRLKRKAIYLFAGKMRKSDVGRLIEAMAKTANLPYDIEWEIAEVDLLRDPTDNLLNADLQQTILEDIRKGVYTLVIASLHAMHGPE